MSESITRDLRNKNFKITSQRIAILEEIERNGHMDINEVYANVKGRFPAISLATIYKNISVFCDANILREIKAPNHKQKYELTSDKHIHVSCEICGKLEDIRIDTQEIRKIVSEASEYELYDISAVFIGMCHECLSKSNLNKSNDNV